jgi:hypothetical protein
MSVMDHIDTAAPAPDWLKQIGAEAKSRGLNKLTMRQIDAEIAAARRERRQKAAQTNSSKRSGLSWTPTSSSLHTSTRTVLVKATAPFYSPPND